ncbi:uncharacterized protein PSFLO_04956 [Pseudozyma flocculosa]|uniref:Uncharacterized protein n=1 Tax=Pseudozyma flocculosa TaxID=84751 RepID=A0A5C3F6V3_9BASI|nr:uncharacterized protein PSFLO_04956 [Pseudozyma flocculosa]
MLTPISLNTTPVKAESSAHKRCCSPDGKSAIRDVENASKLKAIKENLKAKKEAKGPILKRKMACATCRRRKASAEAAGHPSAVPPGPCSYDCDQHDEPVQSRFFANGSFHALTFHSNYRAPMNGPMEPLHHIENLNVLPQSSPYGVWTWGEVPLTPSRQPNYQHSASAMSTPITATPTRPPPLLTSTPMRRIISPGLTINATPMQDNDVFYSPSSQPMWTPPPPQQQLSVEPMFVSPMVSPLVANFSEAMYATSSSSSAASTPSLMSARHVRSPFPMMQDLGTPASLAPSTPCSETFDTNFLGPPIMPTRMLSPQEQQLKCTNFLESLEPMPCDLFDFNNGSNGMSAAPQESFALLGHNQLGLVDGPVESKLQEPFTSLQLGLPDLPSFQLDAATSTMATPSSLSGAMPFDMAPPGAMPVNTTEWAF